MNPLLIALINRINEGSFSEADEIFNSEMANISLSHVEEVINETSDVITGNVNEKIKTPEGFDQFIKVAKQSKDGNEFVKLAQKIKGVPNSTSEWFRNKYDPDEKLSMSKVSDKFIKDVNDGLYEDNHIILDGGENSLLETDENKKLLKIYLKSLSEQEITDDIVMSFLHELRGHNADNIDTEIKLTLDEAERIFKVNSKGKKRVKIKCPKGQKGVDGSCKPIGGTEKIARRLGALSAKKTKKAKGEGAKRKMVFKSNKAKAKRKAFGL